MVVVDDLHVVYRVYGGGADKGTAASALLRMIRRQRRPSIREVHAIRGMSFVAYRGDAVGVIGLGVDCRAIAGCCPPAGRGVHRRHGAPRGERGAARGPHRRAERGPSAAWPWA
jgi:teichoic acid transport system ATP-binding protein